MTEPEDATRSSAGLKKKILDDALLKAPTLHQLESRKVPNICSRSLRSAFPRDMVSLALD